MRLHDDVQILNLKNYKFKKLTTTGEHPRFGKYGHTALNYLDRYLVVFGGQVKYNVSFETR